MDLSGRGGADHALELRGETDWASSQPETGVERLDLER